MNTQKINGIDLHYLDQGQGPVLLLVHGFPLDHSMWAGQTAFLAATRRLIVPDLRGFGGSKSTDELVSMAQFAADLHALLDALSIDDVDFCGLSMGGYIGWEFAFGRPGRTRKLVMCDTRAAADSPAAAEGRIAMADRVVAEGTGFLPDLMVTKLFAPQHIQAEASFVAATSSVMRGTSPLAVAAAQRGMACRNDFTSRLAELAQPALLLCGEHDELTPPAEMSRMADAMPQANFVSVENAGHMAPLEQSHRVNALITEFLA